MDSRAPASYSVPSVPRSVASVRRWAVDSARDLGWESSSDVLALLVSEVATNAVVHGSGEVQVRVLLVAQHLRIEVSDEADGVPAPRRSDLEAEGGRGLALVEALSTAWGVEATSTGKTVWFELA